VLINWLPLECPWKHHWAGMRVFVQDKHWSWEILEIGQPSLLCLNL
jgi:hypothetical protein